MKRGGWDSLGNSQIAANAAVMCLKFGFNAGHFCAAWFGARPQLPSVSLSVYWYMQLILHSDLFS